MRNSNDGTWEAYIDLRFILCYFSQSHFYEKKCGGEILRSEIRCESHSSVAWFLNTVFQALIIIVNI